MVQEGAGALPHGYREGIRGEEFGIGRSRTLLRRILGGQCRCELRQEIEVEGSRALGLTSFPPGNIPTCESLKCRCSAVAVSKHEALLCLMTQFVH